MNILALETSTEIGSCALLQGQTLIERLCPAGRSHSETLLPLVRELVDQAGLRIGDLDAIAFGAGPGAFTGLRVACAAAQGLAVAAELPLLAIGTLEAMAEASGAERVLVVLDARMNEVYWGAHVRGQGGWECLEPIAVGAADQVRLPSGTGWRTGGNALTAYPALAARLTEAGLTVLSDLQPRAGAVARLAARRWQRGDRDDPALAAPIYIRNKVAQTVAERLAAGGRA